jgi:hypothetical protein
MTFVEVIINSVTDQLGLIAVYPAECIIKEEHVRFRTQGNGDLQNASV